MATPAQKTRVGIFLTLCAVGIAAAVLTLLGYQTGTRDQYWVEFNESVLGLYAGGMVEYKGVPVGKVLSIDVSPQDTARVLIEVDPTKVALHEGTTAQLVMYSLATGTMAVSLSGSDLSRAPLQPGSNIPASPSVVASFMAEFPEIMEEIRNVLVQVSDGLEGLETGKLAHLINHVDEAVVETTNLIRTTNETIGTVAERMDPVFAELEGVMEDIRVLSTRATELTDAVTQQVEPLQLGETERKLQETIDGVNALIARLNSAAETFENAGELVMFKIDNVEFTFRDGMRTLVDTLRSIQNVAELIREDPSAILRGRDDRARR